MLAEVSSGTLVVSTVERDSAGGSAAEERCAGNDAGDGSGAGAWKGLAGAKLMVPFALKESRCLRSASRSRAGREQVQCASGRPYRCRWASLPTGNGGRLPSLDDES